MTMAAKKIKILDHKGQALIEFVLFLPFMMMMYMSILTIGNAINGSINQQKITRGYFYYRLSNNSTMPRPLRDPSRPEPSEGWSIFGMQIIGWADKFEGRNPVSACYKFALPFEDSEEECDDKFTETKTPFIRTETVYGLCGATYQKHTGSNQNVRHPDSADGFDPTLVIRQPACLITQ